MTTETVIEDETDVRRSSCPCSHCQKPATFMCSSCEHEGPRYCSIECQKAHWKTRHYKDCKAAKRNRALIREASARVRSTTAVGETQPNEEIAMNDLSNNTHQTEDNDSVYTDEGDLRYYTIQIYRIIKPVVACIILSIFWVKVAFGSSSEYRYQIDGFILSKRYADVDYHYYCNY
ncbi:MAG: hypothetical protein EXX96DRAFT_550374 [Benjaminiella poitrasii]|nr:MAG: hypothetical protein EXX96DRAFT_550374 [Benjaminiella poitrasii]